MTPLVNVVIPTVEGREEYLERCMRGYTERTEAAVKFFVIQDAPTCGLAWQVGADHAQHGYLHFTADDIVPGEGWFPPMAEAVKGGSVPVARVVTPTPEVLDEDQFPLPGNPLSRQTHYFEGVPRHVPDGYVAQNENEYPSIPFCSLEQWADIGPMIASHYGTDRHFGLRAKAAGYPNVCRENAIFYHYAALPGRAPREDGWLHLDRITFDLNVAFPEYRAGNLQPWETHPLYGTDEGRQLARNWYAANVPGPGYWVLSEPAA